MFFGGSIAEIRCCPAYFNNGRVNFMCGIVGYVGESQAAPILLDGLGKLEYRGYDSAGIAVYDGKKIARRKQREG